MRKFGFELSLFFKYVIIDFSVTKQLVISKKFLIEVMAFLIFCRTHFQIWLSITPFLGHCDCEILPKRIVPDQPGQSFWLTYLLKQPHESQARKLLQKDVKLWNNLENLAIFFVPIAIGKFCKNVFSKTWQPPAELWLLKMRPTNKKEIGENNIHFQKLTLVELS